MTYVFGGTLNLAQLNSTLGLYSGSAVLQLFM